MELKINKFAELSNRTLTTPIAIVGDNGVGKTSTMNAYLWCLTGKGKDGSELNEAVYSVNDSLSTRKADVEVNLNGTHFRKVCCSVLQRKRGSDEMVLKSACSNTFYINDVEVTKAVYEAKVNELCQGKPFGLFTDIQYFSRLPKDKQTEIFVEMLNINKNKFFSNLRDYQEVKADLKAVINTIERNVTLIEGFSSELQKTAIPTDFSGKIAEIKAQIDDLMRQRPTLTAEQIAENNEISRKIAELQNYAYKTISTEKQRILGEKGAIFTQELNNRNNVVRCKIEQEKELEKAKKDLKIWENNCEFNFKLPEIEEIRQKIVNYELKKHADEEFLSEYEERNKEASCGLCPHCTDIFCEHRKTDLPSEDDLRRNITQYTNDIAGFYAQIHEIEDNWTKQRGKEYSEITKRISDLESTMPNVVDADKRLETIRKSVETAETEYNEEIRRNEQISKENEQKRAENETKIAALKSKMHIAQTQVVDNKLWSLKAQLTDYEAKQKVYDEVSGHRKGLADSIEKLSQTNSDLTMKRVACERELIAWESADKRYRDELTEKANEMLPEGMRLSLFRPLITGDGYVSEFAITYDSKRYKNTALEIWGNYQLTKVLQKGFGVNLPIFIDDVANIVDDKLLPKGEDVILIVAVKDLPLYYQKPDGII